MPVKSTGPADVLERVCSALLRNDRELARTIATAEYPFAGVGTCGRRYTERQSMRVFLRDRFIDRYSGARLVFPGTLRLLSKLMPDQFPAHRNWKMSESHIVYWELFPTIDHVVPIARGGPDDETNWVTTSMLRNSAKSNWLLVELGWSLRPIEHDDGWDGLVGWFNDYVTARPEYLEDQYLARWRRAALPTLQKPGA